MLFTIDTSGLEHRDQVPVGHCVPLIASQPGVQLSLTHDERAGDLCIVSATAPEVTDAAPMPPRAIPAAGGVWPDMDGAATLDEMLGEPAAVPRRLADGAWYAEAGTRWRMLARDEHAYPSEDEARAALRTFAVRHAQMGGLLSSHRCLVVANGDASGYRIWEIVRGERTLADMLTAAESVGDASVYTAQALRIATFLAEADRVFAPFQPRIDARLDTVSAAAGKPVYAGFIERPVEGEPIAVGYNARTRLMDLLRAQMHARMKEAIRTRGYDVTSMTRALRRRVPWGSSAREVADALVFLMILD